MGTVVRGQLVDPLRWAFPDVQKDVFVSNFWRVWSPRLMSLAGRQWCQSLNKKVTIRANYLRKIHLYVVSEMD